MASTSSSFKTTYDVFLSFRGADTRDNFTSHLYKALCRENIQTFIDDRLDKGPEIDSSLMKVIEESKISVIVFSIGYASSPYCLDELVKILECRKTMSRTAVPIFYRVDPDDVGNQTGVFGDNFRKLETDQNKQRMDKWTNALEEASSLSGWDFKNYRNESLLIEDVASKIRKLCPITSISPPGFVGVESHIKEVMSYLCIGAETDVRSVGIWGMGGIGKTTIATLLFNQISNQFERCCFFVDLREKAEKLDTISIRRSFYSQLFGIETSNIETIYGLPDNIMAMLGRTKVLVVFDDVNKQDQLEALDVYNDWYCKGSRIIITSGDQQVLVNARVNKIYKVGGLNIPNALQLFSMTAFKQKDPPKEFAELSYRVVHYANGVPLALKVLGSSLCSRSLEVWESLLKKLEQLKIPEQDILKILKISYYELDGRLQDIFLDVACYFNGYHKDWVTDILNGCGFPTSWGLIRLQDKCLITIDNNRIKMHDLIQEMGKDIAAQKGTRLWDSKEIHRLLSNNKMNEAVEGIVFDMSDYKEVNLHPAAFSKMCKLRILKIYSSRFWATKTVFSTTLEGGQSDNLMYVSDKISLFHWKNYPYKSLPSSLAVGNLIELNVKCSGITQLWEGEKGPINLKRLDLGGCKNLKKIPNLSYATNLEEIILCECESLIEIHPSINGLSKLVKLDLEGCKNLEILPEIPGGIKKLNLSYSGVKEWSQSSPLHNLSELQMTNCEKIESLPSLNYKCLPISHDDDDDEYFELNLRGCYKLHKLLEMRGNLKRIDISRTAIEELPSSTGCLSSLVKLTMEECECLEILPQSICELKSLEDLNLSGCSKLKKLPPLNGLISLRCLHLKKTALEEISNGIGICELKSLEKLDLSGCSKLGKLPILSGLSTLQYLNLEDTALEEIANEIGICDLKSLEELSLSGCSKLRKLPSLYGLSTLQFLDLDGTALEEIPTDIVSLSSLRRLNLSNCQRLKLLPKLPQKLVHLNVQNCTSLTTVESSLFIRHSFNYVFNYCNCRNLDYNACYNILSQQAQFIFHNSQGYVDSTCGIPGSEIPDWYKHQIQESSLSVDFRHNCFNTLFLGFAFSIVVECNTHFCNTISLKCKCSFENVKDCNTISKCFNGRMVINDSLQSDHVFLWFDHRDKFWRNWLIKNNSNHIKTSFEFEACIEVGGGDGDEVSGGGDDGGGVYAFKVKKCGVLVCKRIRDAEKTMRRKHSLIKE